MKLAILGYGKMGKTVEALALQAGHEIVYKKFRNGSEGELAKAEVAIEFSTPEAAKANIESCLLSDVPVVSGTTGWLEAYPEMVKLCEERNGSLIYASNFSVGVNLFFDLNEKLAAMMQSRPEYKAEITEIHHTQKKDAPSGTAISLAEGIISSGKYKNWSLNAKGEDQLNIIAIREGDVKGTHHIQYESAIDGITISHKAYTREGFAKGAILAAQWIIGRKGVFNMKDVLGI